MATATKKPKLPKKPDYEKLTAKVAAVRDKIVEKQVKPYLQYLLDAAQAKTKYPLSFNTAMGCTCLYCDAPWQRGSWDTIEQAVLKHPARSYQDAIARLKEVMPELYEFAKSAFEFDDWLDNMDPTVPTRAGDLAQDPADYVEEGPLMGCEGAKCLYTGTEGNFIDVGGKNLCEDCANGRGPWLEVPT